MVSLQCTSVSAVFIVALRVTVFQGLNGVTQRIPFVLWCFCSGLQCMTVFHSGYSLEAVSVLQVQHQAVGTEVHFVLGLCHLAEGQTQTTQH